MLYYFLYSLINDVRAGPAPDGHISCQIPLLLKGNEEGRYDLQIVSFWASRNALKIAEIGTPEIAGLSGNRPVTPEPVE